MRPAAKTAMMEAMALHGNASSLHSEGRKARNLIDKSRRIIAETFAIQAHNVYFTSGATEAANWALLPALSFQKQKPTVLLYGAGEHPAIIEGHSFQKSHKIPMLSSGIVDLDNLEAALKANPHALIAVQAANNETGVIQPLRAIADLAQIYGAIFLCDAVQAVGKMNLLELVGADALIISSHKFGGAKGAGALLITSPRVELCEAFIKGGGQEARRRSGTENIASIASMAAALQETGGDFAHVKAIHAHFEELLPREKCAIVGENSPRLNNTTCLILACVKAETALIKLDLKGAAVSSGSACSSGKVTISPVLSAMGYENAQAECAIRVSFGFASTMDDARQLALYIAGL
jgi:cysteine desulfurase